jgi:diadenosine tetraphosphate (Ap4A) HIT family hydrolase
MDANCVFCRDDGGRIVFRDPRCRVVLTDEPFAGFCRVVWNEHAREMTDLAPSDRSHLMDVVFAVETALREMLSPDKMNLASLGNQVPHVHWHVIPRFRDDSHFPRPVWDAAQRDATARALPDDFFETLAARIGAALDGGRR